MAEVIADVRVHQLEESLAWFQKEAAPYIWKEVERSGWAYDEPYPEGRIDFGLYGCMLLLEECGQVIHHRENGVEWWERVE